MTNRKPSIKPRRKCQAYILSINLPSDLIAAIDEEARTQYRTRASVIRQALADKFLIKAESGSNK